MKNNCLKKVFLYAFFGVLCLSATFFAKTGIKAENSNFFYTVNETKSITVVRKTEDPDTLEYIYDKNDFELEYKNEEKSSAHPKFRRSRVRLYAINQDKKEISNDDIEWQSSDTDIVEVDDSGKIFTVGYGTAIISATSDKGLSDSIKVTVPYPTEIHISNNFSLQIGDNTKLYAHNEKDELIPDNAIAWESSAKNIIKLTDKNIANAVGFGTSYITATLPNGVSDTLKVTVSAPKKINIGTSKKNYGDFDIKSGLSANLYVFDEKDFKIPNNVITWKSSDFDVIQISSDGKIQALNAGRAKITATLSNGQSSSINVTVIRPKEIKICHWITETESYDCNDFTLKLGEGNVLGVMDETGEMLLSTCVEPEDPGINTFSNITKKATASNSIFSVKSSDPDVIRVTFNCTINVFANKCGTAKITVTMLNGLSDSINITVPKINKTFLGINWKFDDNDFNNKTFIFKLNEQQQLYLFGEDKHELPTDYISWKNSNKSVITLNESGYIKTIGEGSATVTATIQGVSASVNIIVVKDIKEIFIGRYTENDVDINDFNLKIDNFKELFIFDKNKNPISADNIKWTSSDEHVIRFSTGNTVYSENFGTALITAELPNGVTDTIKITVPYPKKINIGRKPGNYSDFNLKLSDDIFDTDSFEYINAYDEDNEIIKFESLKWTNSNDETVELSYYGCVTAKGLGTAIISAKAPNGISDTIKITVNDNIKVTNVELDKTAITVNVGDIVPLIATVLPENATNKNVEWKSSNTNIVKVNSKGEFKAYKAGKATVSVRTKDGKFIASCKVTVKSVPVTGVKLDKTAITVNVGDIVPLKATVLPENATNKNVEWKSSNTNIVKVNSKGEFKAYKAGKATVSVRTKDGKFIASCKVTVKSVPVTGVELDKTAITVNVGDIVPLKATVLPENATNKNVTWKSSDTKVVKVNSKGEFKTYKKGTATITVTTKDGSRTATCKVTVK